MQESIDARSREKRAWVRLWRVPVFTPGALVGHVFLETPEGCFGWWPRDTHQVRWVRDFFGRRSVEAEVSRAERAWIREGLAVEAWALEVSPSDAGRLGEVIDRHSRGRYQLGNRGDGRNCIGWALERLADAGLPRPKGLCGSTPGLAPWHLK